ncbi:Crp/Fnr family transcriptional regulator [Mesorhizobium sp. CAU 1741]|uniref:Crp/Fnr family transcriptional regulator n=1 Tax=Mesorhizobium sp. CAU 1741 TaxID=3140366 RepID=UPI00325B66F4
MSPAIDILCRSLSRRDTLLPEEMDLLARLSQRPAQYAKGAEIIAEHSRPPASCLLVSGFAARAVSRANGKRQLTALHVPGDFVDLHGLLLRVMDHSVVALSDCTVVFVPHGELRAISETAPHLTRMLWLSTTIDASIQRKMTALLGRHTPLQRLGHLICELYLRLEAVGLAANGRFRFPITQSELSDILGLSLVHTNRTVQELRATDLVAWDHTNVTVRDFDALARATGFDPTYLNLTPEPR